MRLNVYAIYDRLGNNYSNPFVLNERIAKRQFDYMAREYSDIDCTDREIHHIGWYDNETGELAPMEPAMNVYDLEENHKNARS